MKSHTPRMYIPQNAVIARANTINTNPTLVSDCAVRTN